MKETLHKSTIAGLVMALVAMLWAGDAVARRLTPDEAVQRVAATLQQSRASRPMGPLKSPADVASSLRLSYTSAEVGAEKVPAFYVFNVAASRSGEGGFVIATGDDRLRPILAIADGEAFDADRIPENVAWWFGQYEQEIAAFLDSPAAGLAASPAASAAPSRSVLDNYAEWTAIEPLLSTRWNQNEPYNNDCPQYSGIRCVTGCVATAMAQIVRYHELPPPAGNGTKTYTGSYVTASYDFSNPAFDWENMIDDYSASQYTSTQAAAVANLMKACGVAVEMNYGPYESGASSLMVPSALSTYFGFDGRTTTRSRSAYDTPEWEAMIYAELSNKRPVYYDGASPEGGHAFVCDGYDQDGLFHFNWGWGGYCDAYFALSALNPSGQGIGGYAGGYNIGQSVVLCFPPSAENMPDVPVYEFVQYADFSSAGVSNNGDSFKCSVGFSRAPQLPVEFYPAVGVEDADGVMRVARSGTQLSLISTNQYYPSFQMSFNISGLNLPAGKYRVFPMASVKQSDGTFTDWELQARSYVHDLTLSVSASGSRSYKVSEAGVSKPNIEVVEFKALNDFYRESSDNAFSVTLLNSGDKEYNNMICYVIGSLGFGQTGLILPATEARRFEQTLPIPAELADASEMTIEVWEAVGGGYRKLCETALTVPILDGARPSAGQSEPAEVQISVDDPYLTFGEEFGFKAILKDAMNICARLYKHGTDVVAAEMNYGYWPLPQASTYNLSVSFPQSTSTKAGLFDLVVFNYDTDEDVSNRVTLSFGGKSLGFVYYPNLDGNGVRVSGYTGASSRVRVSEKIGGLKVTAIGSGFLKGNKTVKSLEIPASVTDIGEDALRFTSNLSSLFINSPEALEINYPQLIMYGTNPSLAVYVPESAYDGYLDTGLAKAYTVYKRITELSLDKSEVEVKVGAKAEINVATLPAADVNAAFTVTVSDENVVAATVDGSTVSIQGLTPGEATVTIASVQPYVTPVEVKVTVPYKPTAVESIMENAAGEAEFFDFQGRRLTAPRGNCIKRVRRADGTVTTTKILR